MATRTWVVHLHQNPDFPRSTNDIVVAAHQVRFDEHGCIRFVADDGGTEAIFPIHNVLCVTAQHDESDPPLR